MARRARVRSRNFRSRKAYLAWNRGEKFATRGRLSRRPERITVRGRRVRVSHRRPKDHHGRGSHWVEGFVDARGRRVPGRWAKNPSRRRGRS